MFHCKNIVIYSLYLKNFETEATETYGNLI